MNLTSFFDELVKISGVRSTVFKAVAIPTATVFGWEQAKKEKRRRDIGKAYEQQMAEAQGQGQ